MNFSTRHLFIDLEDTVITPVLEGWWKTECINVAKVKSVIEAWRPHQIHLFSFAIWNQDELEKFRLGTKPMLEERFGITLASDWTVDDQIMPMCARETSISLETLDFQEMSAFWGKAGAFRLCMRQHFKTAFMNHNIPIEAMLLDDAVHDEHFEWPERKFKGHILNIDNLKDF